MVTGDNWFNVINGIIITTTTDLVYFSYSEMSLGVEWREKYVPIWMKDLGSNMSIGIIQL